MTGVTTLKSFLFLLSFVIITVSGYDNHRYCDLREETIHTVYFDKKTGNYRPHLSTSSNKDVVIRGNSYEDNSNRNLRSKNLDYNADEDAVKTKSSWPSLRYLMESLFLLEDEDLDDAITVKNDVIDEESIVNEMNDRRLSSVITDIDEDESSSSTSEVIIEMRRCSCVDQFQTNDESSYYCSIENDYCYIPRRYNAGGFSSSLYPPYCLHNNDRRHSFIKNAWPIVLIIFGLLLLCSVCTLRGNFALSYIIAKCFPKSFNKRYVKYLLYIHPLRSREMIYRWCIQRRDEIEDRYFSMLQQQYQQRRQQQQHQQENNNDQQQILHDSSDHDAVVEEMQLDNIEEALIRGATSREKSQPMLLLRTRIYKKDEELIIHEDVDCPNSPTKSTTGASDDDTNSQSSNSQKDDDEPDGGQKHHHHTYSDDHRHHNHHNYENEAISAILSDDEDEEPTEYYHVCCTICFGPIHDGDRVGALQCHHTFHVDCLKVWLKRRNVCPLCLREDVAQKH